MMEEQSIKKSTIVTIVIVLLVIVGGTSAWLQYGRGTDKTPTGDVVEDVETMRITAKHQFKNGKHIIAGEVNLPTPCYVLDTQAIVAESYPEQVTVAFTATTGADMCAQVITTERFKVEFTASKDASIKATWNGAPAILNLIPAGENEDLTNFEVFIKG
jgi:hypothetical protein